MIKMKTLVTGLLFIAGSCFAYNRADVTQWHETNSCINCDLSRISIYDKDHNFTTLENTKMFYSNIRASYFRQSNFSGVYLSKSAIHSSFFTECDFTNAHLNMVNFSDNSFSGAKFINADLKNSDFSNSNLSSTDFTDAKLDGITLTGAILIGSNLSAKQLSKAKSLKYAILPDGSLAPK